MKLLLITLVNLIASLGLAAAPCNAQAGAGSADGPVLWSGAAQKQLDPAVAEVLALPDRELGKLLSEIRVDLAATGDRPAAARALAVLRVRAARSDSADAQTLRNVALIRCRFHLDGEQTTEALAALLNWLPDQAEVTAMLGPVAVQPPTAALLQQIADAQDDPQLNQLREALAGQPADGEDEDEGTGLPTWLDLQGMGLTAADVRYVVDTFGRPTKEMFKEVHRCVVYGESGTILNQLRAYAMPSLALLSLVTRDEELTDFEFDPLAMLMGVDEGAALKLMQDRFEHGGSEWRRRVAVAVLGDPRLRAVPLRDESLWSFGDGEVRASRCLRPARVTLIGRLLVDELLPEVLDALAVVAFWDGLDATITRRLSDVVRNRGRLPAFAVLEALSTDQRLHSAVPVYVAGLESADGDVRRECAQRLTAFGPRPELLARVRDADPDLRLAVAQSMLRGDQLVRVADRGSVQMKSLVLEPELDAASLAALETLLADDVEAVQRQALRSLRSHKRRAEGRLLAVAMSSAFVAIRREAASAILSSISLERQELAELYELILSDASSQVRRLAVRSHTGGTPLDLQLLIATRLASDPDPQVLDAVDVALGNWSNFSPAALVAALELRMAHPTRPFRPLAGTPTDWVSWAWNKVHGSDAVFVDLARVGLEWPATGLLDAALGAMARQRSGSGLDLLQTLPPDAIARVYAWAVDTRFVGLESMADALDGGHDVVRLAMAELLLDEQQGTTARLAAAGWVPDVLWSTESRQALAELLRQATPEDVEFVADIMTPQSTAADANAYALDILEDGAVCDAAKLWMASVLFDGQREGADEVARLLLERWLGKQSVGLHAAVRHLATGFAGDETLDLLRRAAADTSLVYPALGAMSEMNDPAVIPVLQQMLTSGETPSRALSGVINTLLRYGPAARDALRTGLLVFSAGTTAGQVRTALDALDRFEAEGATGTTRLVSRDGAAAELLALLGDASPAVRAEAAKGLATLGAVEALPALIGRLSDPDDGVRAAVRESLDRLHAAQPQGVGAGPDHEG